MPHATYDGQPISPDPPFGVSIIVYRRARGATEFLLLHRAHRGWDYEGDWAWTPPAGARWPGEDSDECARRELQEEAGLSLHVERIGQGTSDWLVYVAEAPSAATVVLSVEHDRYAWFSAEDAYARCAPELVATQVRSAAAQVDLTTLRPPPSLPA